MIIVYLVIILGFSLLLIKAAEVLTDGVRQLADLTNLTKFNLTVLLMALINALPELVICVIAALNQQSLLALGIILGSNIANLSLVVGTAAVAGGGFSVAGEFLRMDIISIFLAGLTPFILLLDGRLSPVDGLILLGIYALFASREIYYPKEGDYHLRRFIISRGRKKKIGHWLIRMGLGAATLILSGEMIVRSGLSLAGFLGAAPFLIGLITAIGTTLPELSFEIKAVRRHEAAMVLGNLCGQLMANSTLILGITALISPIKLLSGGLRDYGLGLGAFALIFILFWIFTKTKKKLERWEGAMLVGAYLGFMILEWWRK
jgi:cation:H+ antiporter